MVDACLIFLSLQFLKCHHRNTRSTSSKGTFPRSSVILSRRSHRYTKKVLWRQWQQKKAEVIQRCLEIVFFTQQCGVWQYEKVRSKEASIYRRAFCAPYRKFQVLLFWTTVIAMFGLKTANKGTERKTGQICRPNCILYNISQNALPELSH